MLPCPRHDPAMLELQGAFAAIHTRHEESFALARGMLAK